MKQILITIILILLYCNLYSTHEKFDLSAAFVDLSTYGELDKYLYN